MRSNSKSTIARLRTARGHLESIIRMVETDRYCIDVLHQLTAVQGSLDGVRREILQAHLRGCLPEAIDDRRVDEAVAEVVGAIFGAAPRRNRDHVMRCVPTPEAEGR